MKGRSLDSEDVQNFLHAKERGVDVHLFVRKNKDDKISKEFYYLDKMTSAGKIEEIVMTNTNKTAVEIEWMLDTPVREDIYEYIVNNWKEKHYDYPKFHLSMDCFICKIKSGNLVLKEHEAAKWLTKETLDSVAWLPADKGVVEKIRNIQDI